MFIILPLLLVALGAVVFSRPLKALLLHLFSGLNRLRRHQAAQCAPPSQSLFTCRLHPDPPALHVLRHGIGGGVILHAQPLCLFCRHAHNRRLGLSVLLPVELRRVFAGLLGRRRSSCPRLS